MPREHSDAIDLEELRRLIRASSRTGAEVAREAGISRVYLYQILGGQKTPSSEVVAKLAEALSPRDGFLLLGNIYASPERAFRLWQVTQRLLLDTYDACRDDEERYRFFETLWVPMRMVWWTRGSARRVAECREALRPNCTLGWFGDWLSKQVKVEDRVACTLGLLCWREPEMMFALHRAPLPVAFDLAQHTDRIPEVMLKAVQENGLSLDS